MKFFSKKAASSDNPEKVTQVIQPPSSSDITTNDIKSEPSVQSVDLQNKPNADTNIEIAESLSTKNNNSQRFFS